MMDCVTQNSRSIRSWLLPKSVLLIFTDAQIHHSLSHSLNVSILEVRRSQKISIPLYPLAKESFSSSTILPHSFLFFVSQLSSAFAIVFGICCFTNRSHQKTTRISDRYLSYILEYHKFIGSQTSHHRQRVVAIVKKKSLL